MESNSEHTENSAYTIAFAILLLSPFVFPGQYPFDVNLLLAVAAAVLFSGLFLIGKHVLFLPKIACIFLLLLLAAQAALYTVGRIPAPESWQLQSALYLTAMLMFIIGVSTPKSDLFAWIKAYLLIALLWSATGLFVWLGGTFGQALQFGPVTLALPPSIKIAGPFNQGNAFAAAIGIAWLLCHWMFIREKDNRHAVLILFFTAMLFDSLSRGAWITYPLVLSALLYSLRVDFKDILMRLAPLWIGGLILGVLFLQYRTPLPNAGDISFITDTAATSLSARFLIWTAAVQEFISAPLTGVGWGQFATHFWTAKPEAMAWMNANLGMEVLSASVPYSAHNLFLHVLAEAGIVALCGLLWGCLRLFTSTFELIKNGKSIRLVFALSAIAFVLQSQVNVLFFRPLLLLLAALFAGIALAPWLRKSSWNIRVNAPLKISALIITCLTLIWTTNLISLWFNTEHAIIKLDVNKKSTMENIAAVADYPRTGAIALPWLGYVVAMENRHTPLLTWLQPRLRRYVHETPALLSYQVLYYSHAIKGEFEQACQIGALISAQKIPGEVNRQIYEDICRGITSDRFTFGTR